MCSIYSIDHDIYNQKEKGSLTTALSFYAKHTTPIMESKF